MERHFRTPARYPVWELFSLLLSLIIGINGFFPMLIMLICWKPTDIWGVWVKMSACVVTKIIYGAVVCTPVVFSGILAAKGKISVKVMWLSIGILAVLSAAEYGIIRLIFF